jgi:hypothetical protein
MPLAYDGLENQTLDRVATWLAASADFQAFTGTADATAARGCIVEVESSILAAPHAMIPTPRVAASATIAHHALAQVEVDVWILAPPVQGDTPAEDFRRALADLHRIRAALVLAAVDSRFFAGVETQPPVRLAESDGLAGWMQSGISLRFGPLGIQGWPA